MSVTWSTIWPPGPIGCGPWTTYQPCSRGAGKRNHEPPQSVSLLGSASNDKTRARPVVEIVGLDQIVQAGGSVSVRIPPMPARSEGRR